MRKFILSILGILFIIGSYYIGEKIIASKKKRKSIPEKVVKTVFIDTVKNGEVKIVIPANGRLVAKRRIELYAEVQGIFKKGSKLFKPGQKFSRGQTLIHIDEAEFYSSVQSAKSNLYNSIAAIMPDLKLDFPEAFNKWQSYINSYDINKLTPELPQTTSDKENYFITGRGIISNYYNVKNLEQRLAKYRIFAPFSGVLIETLANEGALIRNGQKLGTFIDTSVYEMEVAISKTYANLLKEGKQVAINNLDKTEYYKGLISRINGSIDPTTQTITAYIEVKNKALKEGMYLEANLNVSDEKEAIEVDRSLVFNNNQIYVVKGNVLDVMEVKPVYFSDKKAVLKNIPNGTIILKRPVPGAYAGMLVKPFVTPTKSLTKK